MDCFGSWDIALIVLNAFMWRKQFIRLTETSHSFDGWTHYKLAGWLHSHLAGHTPARLQAILLGISIWLQPHTSFLGKTRRGNAMCPMKLMNRCMGVTLCLTRISDVKTKNPCSIWVRHGTILWSDGILYSAGILSKNISKLRYVPSCWLLPPTRTCHLYYFVVLSASVVHLRMLSVASVTWQRCSDRWLKTAVGRLEMTSLGYNLEI